MCRVALIGAQIDHASQAETGADGGRRRPDRRRGGVGVFAPGATTRAGADGAGVDIIRLGTKGVAGDGVVEEAVQAAVLGQRHVGDVGGGDDVGVLCGSIVGGDGVGGGG